MKTYPHFFLGFAGSLRIARPVAWTISTLLLRGSIKATQSTDGKLTPSVKQRALEISPLLDFSKSARIASRSVEGIAPLTWKHSRSFTCSWIPSALSATNDCAARMDPWKLNIFFKRKRRMASLSASWWATCWARMISFFRITSPFFSNARSTSFRVITEMMTL